MALDDTDLTAAPAPSGTDAPAPAATPAAQPDAPSPPSFLDTLDAEEARMVAALEAAGQSVDGTTPAAAPPPAGATPATPAAPAVLPADQAPDAPVMIPKWRLDQVLREREGLLNEIAARDRKLAEAEGFARGQAAATAAQPAAAPAAPAKPQITPQQVLDQIETKREALDKQYENSEITYTELQKHLRALDRQEKIVISRTEAHAAATRTAEVLRKEIPTADAGSASQLHGSIQLHEKTAELLQSNPWLNRVPKKICEAYRDDAYALAQREGIKLDNTELGTYRFRYCLMAVLKHNGMDRAYGQGTGTPAGAPAAAAPALPPGAAPIPAPRAAIPPSLARSPTGAGLTTAVTAERIASMPFHEAAGALSDEAMEAIAPSR